MAIKHVRVMHLNLAIDRFECASTCVCCLWL